MSHKPSGRGIAEAIKRNAVPAVIYAKDDASGISDKWRRIHDVNSIDINIYVILQEEEMDLKEEGEESLQWALLYNTDLKLGVGWQIRFPDQGWRFVIRKSVRRPALNPVYFKAWGVTRA